MRKVSVVLDVDDMPIAGEEYACWIDEEKSSLICETKGNPRQTLREVTKVIDEIESAIERDSVKRLREYGIDLDITLGQKFSKIEVREKK